MSMTGLCQLCEQNEAEHSCPNCGTLVCESHWNDANSLCTQCTRTLERGDSGEARPEDVDDSDVMQF